MRKVALRGLLAHKGRLVATFVAVALGVAFVGGVLTLTDTMNRTFEDLFADVFRDTDAVVRSDDTVGDNGLEGGATRGSLPASVAEEVDNADGVAVAAGNVEDYAQVIDPDGDPVGDPMTGAPTFGANWVDVDELNPFHISEGRAPEAPDDLVIDAGTAATAGYEVGDTVQVQTRTGLHEFEAVGITRFGTADNPGGAGFVMWTTERAQQLFDQTDAFTSIGVVARDGVSQTEVVEGIEQRLSAADVGGAEVLTGEEITEETQSDVRQSLSFFTTFLLAFAIIAVFVGTFVIYNSFSIIVAQRTREMALLRAIGASRKQVRRAVLAEALVVGAVGSAVGFLLGLGVATVLGWLLELPEGALAILPSSVITAVACGLLVTVGSALIPAWRAARIPPLAAMREVAVDVTGRSLVRLAVGIAMVVLGVLAIVGGATGSEVTTVGWGAALTFLGVLFVSPGLARPVSAVLGAPISRLRGVPGALARENAGRNPKRTSATAQALMIGVGIVAFILVINASVRASFDQALEESFTGDFVVNSGGFGLIGLPTEVAGEIRDLPEVTVAAPVRFAEATVDGDDSGVASTSSEGFRILDLDLVAASPDLEAAVEAGGDLPEGTVVVSEDEAEREGLALGDPVETQFVDDARPPGDRTLAVAGIYASDAGNDVGSYVIGLGEFSTAVPTGTDFQVLVQLAEGVSVAAAEPEIEQVIDPYPTAEVLSVDEYKDMIGGQLDSLLILIGALLFLAIVIAGLGIANTIALSVLERTREIGLLRAVGMSRRQLRSAIRWESAIISLFGTVLGVAVGLLGGWGMVTALGDEGFNVFRVPVLWLVVVSLVAAVMGMAAAVIPAWRASRRDVLEAIEAP